MLIEKLQPFEDVLYIQPNLFKDYRGIFLETYSTNAYEQTFVQDNMSVSNKYVLRGLHWQDKPYEQGKLVSVAKGAVFDVAVDLRKDSPTFGQYGCKVLTADKHDQLYIPEGFAHGFQALDDATILTYKCTSLYNKEAERSIYWASIKIPWPYAFDAVLSQKDIQAPTFLEVFGK